MKIENEVIRDMCLKPCSMKTTIIITTIFFHLFLLVGG